MGYITQVRPEILWNDIISCLGLKSDNERANKESPSGNAEWGISKPGINYRGETGDKIIQ